jgi:hypothetical protein
MQLRPVKMNSDFLLHPEGCCLVEFGNTRVLCTASITDSVPPFLQGSSQGWITSEYAMLPRATHTRKTRESSQGKVSGRTHEIQRLIGRSMRAICDLKKLPGFSIYIDCDVLQADGGTRTASITGAYVALEIACRRLVKQGEKMAVCLDPYERFILEQFSLLKHGETRAIQYFSTLMANYLILNIEQHGRFYQFMMEAKNANKRLLVTSPATRFISNSASLLAKQLVHDINIYLIKKGYPAVAFRPLHKSRPSDPNYASLTFSQRNELDDSL